MTTTVSNFRDIPKLPIKVRNRVQVSRCGSHYRARYCGKAECTFGATAEIATSRLLGFKEFGRGPRLAPKTFTKW